MATEDIKMDPQTLSNAKSVVLRWFASASWAEKEPFLTSLFYSKTDVTEVQSEPFKEMLRTFRNLPGNGGGSGDNPVGQNTFSATSSVTGQKSRVTITPITSNDNPTNAGQEKKVRVESRTTKEGGLSLVLTVAKSDEGGRQVIQEQKAFVAEQTESGRIMARKARFDEHKGDRLFESGVVKKIRLSGDLNKEEDSTAGAVQNDHEDLLTLNEGSNSKVYKSLDEIVDEESREKSPGGASGGRGGLSYWNKSEIHVIGNDTLETNKIHTQEIMTPFKVVCQGSLDNLQLPSTSGVSGETGFQQPQPPIRMTMKIYRTINTGSGDEMMKGNVWCIKQQEDSDGRTTISLGGHGQQNSTQNLNTTKTSASEPAATASTAGGQVITKKNPFLIPKNK